MTNVPTDTPNRLELWVGFLQNLKAQKVAEVGVWKGDFAARVLKDCPEINEYVMIDPWAHLPDWNKPFNVDSQQFDEIYDEAMAKTAFAESKRVVLRNRMIEAAPKVDDEHLDFVYIDGDHTLRGITIDLISIFAKIKPGGFIGGDDFASGPWQHSKNYEPTLVFPFAVYFAEAMNCPITALPHDQFLIAKTNEGFKFTDETGKYQELGLTKRLWTSGSFKNKVKGKIKHVTGIGK